MRKLSFLFLVCLLALTSSAWAYDFSAVTSSGQTLYYNINSDGTTVSITYPHYQSYNDYYSPFTKPTGDLTVPSSVAYNGTTYSVTSIGTYAFAYCSGLTSVTIPNSVTTIGNYAFYYDSSFTSITIPNSVTTIGNSAFSGCIGLTSVTIPNSVDTIGNSAFYKCSGLTSVNIGNSVTSIGNSAFSNTGLTSVIIPNSVTSIGISAFFGCSSLTSITIPNSVTSIGGSAFHRIPLVNYLGSATGSPWGALCVNGFMEDSLVYTDNTKTTLVGAHKLITSASIPTSVTSIGNYAFYNYSSLSSVTIGNSVTSIGDYVFYGCSGLTSVTIPNSVTSIGEYAFSDDTSLTSVSIPNSVTSLGSNAFFSCTGLNSVIIGNSLDTIKSWTFCNCTALISVVIGNSVTYIGDYAFSSDCNMTSLYIHSHPTLTNISFSYCQYSNCTLYIPCGMMNQVSASWPWSNFVNKVENCITVTTLSNSTMGTVSGGGQTTPGTDITLTATPNAHYHFVQWNDGNTDNPRTILAESDTSFTAIFEGDPYTVTANNAYGGGTYPYGTTITLMALPQVNGQFAGWSDGNISNPRNYTVLSNTTITAIFVNMDSVINSRPVAHDTLMVYTYDTVVNIVYDTVVNVLHDTVLVTQYIYDTTEFNHYFYDTTIVTNTIYDTTEYNHYFYDTTVVTNTIYDTTEFNHYFYDTTIVTNTIYDTNYYYDTTTVNTTIYDTTVYIHYYYDTTVVFDTTSITHYVFDTIMLDPVHYTLSVSSANINQGLVAGNGEFPEGTVVEIAAIPIEGHRFVSWNDNNTDNPRQVTLTEDKSFTASFGTVSTDAVVPYNFNVFAVHDVIVVENADGNRVRIFDAVGRQLTVQPSVTDTYKYKVPASGVYLIQVGDYPARKVTIVK